MEWTFQYQFSSNGTFMVIDMLSVGCSFVDSLSYGQRHLVDCLCHLPSCIIITWEICFEFTTTFVNNIVESMSLLLSTCYSHVRTNIDFCLFKQSDLTQRLCKTSVWDFVMFDFYSYLRKVRFYNSISASSNSGVLHRIGRGTGRTNETPSDSEDRRSRGVTLYCSRVVGTRIMLYRKLKKSG